MKHTNVTFRGQAALPGIFLTITRVNRGRRCFFSFMQTGHLKAERPFTPLCSISNQLVSEYRNYPIKQRILDKGWNVEQCAFRMWLLGRIDEHPACNRFTFTFQQWCILAWLLGDMIKLHLDGLGHETYLPRFGHFKASDHQELAELAAILFEEFLRDIAPSLLDHMDIEFDENADHQYA